MGNKQLMPKYVHQAQASFLSFVHIAAFTSAQPLLLLNGFPFDGQSTPFLSTNWWLFGFVYFLAVMNYATGNISSHNPCDVSLHVSNGMAGPGRVYMNEKKWGHDALWCVLKRSVVDMRDPTAELHWAMVGASEKGREGRRSKESAWEPGAEGHRDCSQNGWGYIGIRNWGKGKEAQGLERFRAGAGYASWDGSVTGAYWEPDCQCLIWYVELAPQVAICPGFET